MPGKLTRFKKTNRSKTKNHEKTTFYMSLLPGFRNFYNKSWWGVSCIFMPFFCIPIHLGFGLLISFKLVPFHYDVGLQTSNMCNSDAMCLDEIRKK